ncbi:hypothetical protein MYU51_017625 [Penicillium brevicompactum]
MGSSAISDGQSPPSQRSKRDPITRSRSASPPRGIISGVQLQNTTVEIAAPNDSDGRSITEAEEEPRRFACDSNPMATLLENDGLRLQKGNCQKGDVGAWLSPDDYSVEQSEEPSRSLLPKARPTSQHDDGVPSERLPPKRSQDALLDIYFRRIHPVLPILDETMVRNQYKADTQPICLVQAICLVASKDPAAASFLCLGHHAEPLGLERFTSVLYNDLLQSIPRRSERKILTIQVLALLSLHEWGTTGSEDCSLNLAQAIHHAQTLGLHLMRPDQHPLKSPKALFWCLWSLDRWNAAMHGRPLMIHDGDRGQGVDDVVSSFPSTFRVWLKIADKLGETIHHYRPMTKDTDQGDLELPSFDELVEQCEAWDMDADQLVSLDFVYHSVVILSTHSKGLQGRLQSQMSNIRQEHSILTLASLSCNQDVSDYFPLPMIGYTVSIAFSVTYKQLRTTRSPSVRHISLSKLRHFHRCLQKISTTWWSAAVMARLGKRVLNSFQPTIDQERSTDHEIDITRSNSQPELRHTSQNSLELSTNTQYHSNFEVGEASGETEPVSESAHHLNNTHLGSINHSDSNDTTAGPFGSSELEDFDLFFDNFPDLNFPSYSNDQFLSNLDIEDFELVTDRF